MDLIGHEGDKVQTETVSFEWKGRHHKISQPSVRQMLSFYEAQRALSDATAEGDDAMAFTAIVRMLEAVGCPREVLDDCPAVEIGDLVSVISSALWPEASGNAGGGASTR